MAKASHRPDEVAYLDFSFFLPMEEHLRADHIQDAVRDCCDVRPEDGAVVIDEFAPTQRNESLCVKGYVQTIYSKHERIMHNLATQFSRDGITEYLMDLLEIESPVLRAENFMCHYASEGPEANAEMLELEQESITEPNIHTYQTQSSAVAGAAAGAGAGVGSASSASSGGGAQNLNSRNKIVRNAAGDNGAPSDALYPIEEMHQAHDPDAVDDPNKQDASFLDDAEFEDPNLPLGKKFESFRKLLEQYIDDCENMYDQLLQECDHQIQQNY